MLFVFCMFRRKILFGEIWLEDEVIIVLSSEQKNPVIYLLLTKT